jgi:hypothetical protein
MSERASRLAGATERGFNYAERSFSFMDKLGKKIF